MRPARRPRRVPSPAAVALTAVLLAGALIGVVTLVRPSAAWAHARLLGTRPAGSATVTTPISEVALTFDEPVRGRFSVVAVDGPGGRSYDDGPVRVVDSTVHQRVRPLATGPYTVAWRVVSADGHPVEGRFRFTAAPPASGSPRPA